MQLNGIMVRQAMYEICLKKNSRVPQPSTCTHPLFSYMCLSDPLIQFSYAGRIEVHNPHKLEANVLKKYFRHSKYASFQRQLNYFGWRKLNGKGKMAPCTYINDEVTPDIECLLTIKVRSSGLFCTFEIL